LHHAAKLKPVGFLLVELRFHQFLVARELVATGLQRRLDSSDLLLDGFEL
jgi:hypothetical protein